MKKLLSCFIFAAMILNSAVISFAASSNDVTTFTYDGEEYSLEVMSTDDYRRSVVLNAAGEIVADFTYDLVTRDLMDNLSGVLVPRTSNMASTVASPSASGDGDYKYLETNTYTFDLARYTLIGIITAAGTAMGGPVAAGFSAAVTAAISDDLSSIYLSVDTYTRGDADYFYIKRVGTLYSDNDDVLYGPWETVQKVKQK